METRFAGGSISTPGQQQPENLTGLPTETLAATATSRALHEGLLLKERYRIVKELGSGGFATVYLAQDEQLVSKPVVVKVLHRLTADAWLLRKFQQEKEALVRIDHP